MQPNVSNLSSSESAENILATKGRSFHWARRLLGKKHALRATRLYRFCRYIDDLGDEEKSTEVSKRKLLETKHSVFSGLSEDEVISDGLSLIKECNIDKVVVFDLIEGVISDTELVRIQDKDCLIRYCYQVAGTVGLMMSQVLDTHAQAAKPFAIDLGIAMQLTNICRDIQTDALLNRRYVPAELVNSLDPESLIYPDDQQKALVRNAVSNLLNCAEQYYISGEAGLSYLPFQARISILVAARVYREIGREHKKKNFEYWHHRIVVSTPRKLFITFTTLFSVFFTPGFWRRPSVHNVYLHQALININNPESDIVNKNDG